MNAKKILIFIFLFPSMAAFAFSGGTGTSTDPYLVSTVSDLVEVRSNITTGLYFKQTTDIDLSSYGTWTSIGTYSGNVNTDAFKGTYNGNGHAITGVTISATTGYYGLFGCVSGTIENLGVSGSASSTVAGLGLLAGYISSGGTIQNCYSTGTVTTSGSNAGGLIGVSVYTVTQCYSTATVTATGSASSNIGGFIGLTSGTAGSISQCYSTGSVTNSTTTATSATGGFIGTASVSIANCYATGNVSGGSGRVGGFMGATGNTTPAITYCYSTGTISGTTKGGFIGYFYSGSFTSCFFNSTTSGLSQSYGTYYSSAPTGITAASTSTMQITSTYTSSGWSTSYWSFSSGNYPRLLWSIPTSTTFSGTGNWSASGNWSNGLPGPTTDVTISGTCTVDGDYECDDMTISSGYVVTVEPGYTLTVSNTLTNNAGITGLMLESDGTGTAMLMNNSTGVQATVEQYLVKNQWHYIGIPVTYVEDADEVFHHCYLAWIEESNANNGYATGWEYLSAGDSLISLHGYAVQYDGANDTTVTFTGTLNTGTIDTVFASDNDGWNFISNPYPVTIDWTSSTGVIQENANDAFYIWHPDLNSGTGDYGSYGSYISEGSTNDQTQYIPPMQGFFFQVYMTEAAITFNNNCKVAQSSLYATSDAVPAHEVTTAPETFYADAGMENQSVKLAVTDNDINYDETLIRFNKRATDLFDSHMDAAKLKAIDSKLPQLFSITNGKEYSINTLPRIDEKTILPLQVMVKSTGQHTLVVRELKQLSETTPLILYDESGNVLANLKEGSCKFEGRQGEIKSFYLGFGRTSRDDVADLHKQVSLDMICKKQQIVRPLLQGAFAVQQNDRSINGLFYQF